MGQFFKKSLFDTAQLNWPNCDLSQDYTMTLWIQQGVDNFICFIMKSMIIGFAMLHLNALY